MTRFPTEARQVEGLEGDDYQRYELPTSICANADCEYEATDRHHLFSRSLMGGAYEWVKLSDGTETGNIVGLCFLCHKKVTENKARITYSKDKFRWENKPLRYQPPRKGETVVEGSVSEARPVCVTCKRPLPKPKIEGQKREKKKDRGTWAVAVPIDQREDGAEIIDGLLEAAEEKMDQYGLNWGHGHRVVYHKLVTALALFVQHADEILSDS